MTKIESYKINLLQLHSVEGCAVIDVKPSNFEQSKSDVTNAVKSIFLRGIPLFKITETLGTEKFVLDEATKYILTTTLQHSLFSLDTACKLFVRAFDVQKTDQILISIFIQFAGNNYYLKFIADHVSYFTDSTIELQ